MSPRPRHRTPAGPEGVAAALVCRGTRRRSRRAVVPGLLASAAVHALVLGLPLERPDAPDADGRARRAVTDSRQVMRAIRIVETSGAARAPDAPPAPERPRPPREAGARAAVEPHAAHAPPAARLAPRLTDPRLWRPISPSLWSTDPGRAEQGRIRRRAAAYNRDREGVYISPGEDMGVWTLRDGNDDRWGFSPGAMHLGALTIPLCSGRFDAANCGFGLPPSERDAYHAALRARLEIRLQDLRSGLLERAAAMRARADARRDSARASGG